MSIEIRTYETSLGLCPFEEWFDTLTDGHANKIQSAVRRMSLGNFGDHKSVGSGVMERRLTVGPGYRIYFGRDGDDLVILLVGGTKRRQQKDIEKAKEYWEDYKARKQRR